MSWLMESLFVMLLLTDIDVVMNITRAIWWIWLGSIPSWIPWCAVFSILMGDLQDFSTDVGHFDDVQY